MGEEKASTYFCKFRQYIRSKVTAEKLQKYIGRAHYPENLHLLVSVQSFDHSHPVICTFPFWSWYEIAGAQLSNIDTFYLTGFS